MDAAGRITAGSLGAGLVATGLAGVATRSVPAALVTGAVAATVAGYGSSHLENVREKYDASIGAALAKPSVGISVAAGVLGGGAIAHYASHGLGASRVGAALGLGALLGGATALSAINALGLD